MVDLTELAEAALHRESLRVRSLAQDLMSEARALSDLAAPTSRDPRVRAAAASLIELLAQRTNQSPPTWTSATPPMAEPFYLLEAAERMEHLRKLCETESPEPLKKRGLLAPPNYLEFA